MANILTRSMLLALVAAAVQGCVSTTPRWDREFGKAVHANIAAQVLDPAAAANADPSTGIDGGAARSAHERYQRSFARPEPAQSAPLVGARFGQ
jgi:type IV pilus biogenesis protein CpaD/CtpE